MPIIQPKPVTIEGVTYDSYSQAEKALGWSKGSVSKWVAQQQAQVDADREENVPISEQDGQSVKEAPHLADNVQTKQNEVSDIPQSDAESQEKRLIYGGVEYKTRREMADALEVDYLKLNAYLRRYDDMDEAVDKCLAGETSMSVSYDGTTFRSFTALCEAYKIAPALVKNIVEVGDRDRMDIFSKLAKLREGVGLRDDITLTYIPHCVLQGEPYRSLTYLARQFDIELKTMAEHSAEKGLDGTLLHLQAQRIGAYFIGYEDKLVPFDEMHARIKNGELEHFDVVRKQVPAYPKLQDVEISSQCFDQEQVQDAMRSGQPARDIQQAAPTHQGPVMGGI